MRLSVILPSLMAMIFGAAISAAQDRVAGRLTIYAATSLTDVFEEVGAAFVDAHPDSDILLNFANSATLAAQIAAGAPADLFASANELQMDHVIESGRVDDSAVEIFAHNRLTVIVPADNPGDVQTVADLTKKAVLLVLAAEGTPIRAYTDAMLASYDAEYGENFSERVLRNLVSEESNVRQVVARVALGEADAGVVYQSDALGDVADQLLTISIDDRHNQVASYPIAMLNDTGAQDLALAFILFLRSDEAQSIMAINGFCWPVILNDVQPTLARSEPNVAGTDTGVTQAIECDAATSETR
ncbi:MAG: molybdate ABC transporter substrate-binding protein [Chloroflexi bacterium]|nr:molybdate ABC transporter substrate-binding protein [Chloroflexota bacterium]